MKKLLFFVLIIFAGWKIYTDKLQPQDPQLTGYSDSQISSSAGIRAKPAAPAINFSCDGRQHCSQMRSRAEAEFFVASCPNTKMDGDRDGIPCENDSRF
ncbi:MAG: excalibur calcium-binding domain-containing protein [Halopseudomonas sp.]|uniref:excalibur calcium-binding domain-containing protein n=1 Tax=Halopseudomonas sp. TaxID=2901191 RepID=UPI0030015D4F